jgi:hypothetical protein
MMSVGVRYPVAENKYQGTNPGMQTTYSFSISISSLID